MKEKEWLEKANEYELLNRKLKEFSELQKKVWKGNATLTLVGGLIISLTPDEFSEILENRLLETERKVDELAKELGIDR